MSETAGAVSDQPRVSGWLLALCLLSNTIVLAAGLLVGRWPFWGVLLLFALGCLLHYVSAPPILRAKPSPRENLVVFGGVAIIAVASLVAGELLDVGLEHPLKLIIVWFVATGTLRDVRRWPRSRTTP